MLSLAERYYCISWQIKIRSSCYIVEQKGSEFYCDCPVGSKGHMCKHSVALMYKCGILEVTSDVRSKPLGVKRKRGRPAKLRQCLTKTPPRVPETPDRIPVAQYHQISPELRTISLPQVNTEVPSYSPTLTLNDVDIENIEIVIESTSPVLPRRTRRKRGLAEDDTERPAKRVALTYMEPEHLILSIEKPKPKTKRRNEYNK